MILYEYVDRKEFIYIFDSYSDHTTIFTNEKISKHAKDTICYRIRFILALSRKWWISFYELKRTFYAYCGYRYFKNSQYKFDGLNVLAVLLS